MEMRAGYYDYDYDYDYGYGYGGCGWLYRRAVITGSAILVGTATTLAPITTRPRNHQATE